MTNSLKLRISVIVLAVLMALEVFAPVLTSFADEEDDYIAEESYSESSGTAADSGDLSDDFFDEEDGSDGKDDFDPSEDYLVEDDSDEGREAGKASDDGQEYGAPELLLHPEKLDEMLRAELRKADPEGKTFSDGDIAELANMIRGYFSGTAKLLDVYMKPGVKDSEKEKALEEYKDLFDTDIPGLENSNLQEGFVESGLPETLNKIKERETRFLEGICEYAADGMPAKEYAQDFRRDLDLIFPGLGYGDYADRLVGVLYGTEEATGKLIQASLTAMTKNNTLSDKDIKTFKNTLNKLYPGYGDSEKAVEFATETVAEIATELDEIKNGTVRKLITSLKYENADDLNKAIEEIRDKLNDALPGHDNLNFASEYASGVVKEVVKKYEKRENDFLNEVMLINCKGGKSKEQCEKDLRNDLENILPGLGDGEGGDRLSNLMESANSIKARLLEEQMDAWINKKEFLDKEVVNAYIDELDDLYPGYGEMACTDRFINKYMPEIGKEAEKIKRNALKQIVDYAKDAKKDELTKKKKEFCSELERLLPGFGEGRYAANEMQRMDKVYALTEKIVANGVPNFFGRHDVRPDLEEILRLFPDFKYTRVYSDIGTVLLLGERLYAKLKKNDFKEYKEFLKKNGLKEYPGWGNPEHLHSLLIQGSRSPAKPGEKGHLQAMDTGGLRSFNLSMMSEEKLTELILEYKFVRDYLIKNDHVPINEAFFKENDENCKQAESILMSKKKAREAEELAKKKKAEEEELAKKKAAEEKKQAEFEKAKEQAYREYNAITQKMRVLGWRKRNKQLCIGMDEKEVIKKWNQTMDKYKEQRIQIKERFYKKYGVRLETGF